MRFRATYEGRKWVLHPFLLALFPPVSLLSANLAWAKPGEVLLPAGAVLVLAAALWIALWPLLPDPRKRGIAISLAWVPFYAYGALLDTLRERFQAQDMLGPAAVAGIAVLALAAALAALLLLRRAPQSFEGATRALNRFSAVLLAVAAGACALAIARHAGSGAGFVSPADSQASAKPAADLPNIYFIICDAYPRADYLQDYFEFDNTPFLNALRERGFVVAEKSRSNYPSTLPSLASALNLAYLDNHLAVSGWDAHYPVLMESIRDSVVLRQLKDAGYEYIVPASGLFPAELATADRFIHPGESPYTEYQQRLIDMTPVRSVMNRLKKERWHHRVPFVLDTLEELRGAGRPMFVYAHILAPHLPHSYDADGNILTSPPPYKEGWREVTAFLNRRLLEVIGSILENEPNSVILLLGDHGPNTTWQDARNMTNLPWEGSWEDYVRDRTANLCAWYLPDRQYEGVLYPEITPVNTFRILFNKYLGTDYELLEDVTYLSPPDSNKIIRVDEAY